MERRRFLGSTIALIALPRSAGAQSTTRIFRIGWLTAQKESSLAQSIDALRAALADLKYVEGRNLVIEFRYADDVIERVPELAAELQRIPVDLIMAQGAAVPVISTLGLTVPVVYVFSGDPVVAGLAETLARPRGNMTGLTFMAAELNGKRLELLRELVPRTRRVAIIANPEHPGANLERAYCEDAARQLGLTLKYFPTRTSDELSSAFVAMTTEPPQAVSLFADGLAVQNRQRIIEFATRQRAPVISGWPVFAQSGALCTYGPRLQDSYRRLAYYVDRVLKGARPADLPIERPTTFELVINLKTAKALGVTVPPSLLVRADEVIE
jgi:putative tryptophan/tyrosine transport system substrate-binding protein